jgi:hydroxyacylglutathione hydrolase
MPGAFANAHIPGAISIWTEGLSSFAGWFLPYGKPLLLIIEKGEEETAVRELIRIGFDKIEGKLSGGMHAWQMAGLATVSTGTVIVQGMCRILDGLQPAWLLDVRSDAEIEREGRIKKANHIHITQLPQHIDEIPRDQPIYIFCGSGLRSTIAASLLKRDGVKDLWVVLGGIAGWNSVTCPISKCGQL